MGEKSGLLVIFSCCLTSLKWSLLPTDCDGCKLSTSRAPQRGSRRLALNLQIKNTSQQTESGLIWEKEREREGERQHKQLEHFNMKGTFIAEIHSWYWLWGIAVFDKNQGAMLRHAAALLNVTYLFCYLGASILRCRSAWTGLALFWRFPGGSHLH